jgi:hypothetical protein
VHEFDGNQQFGDEYLDPAPHRNGASSTVYRARSVPFDRDVTVKVFHGGLDDARLRRDFQRVRRPGGAR